MYENGHQCKTLIPFYAKDVKIAKHCRFESCFHHDIVSDVKELIHSACPAARPGKFFLEKHKNKIYEKVINRASCADISAYGNDRGRHSPDSGVRPFLPRMRKGRGKSVE